MTKTEKPAVTEAPTPSELATKALDANLTPTQRRYFDYLNSLVSDLDEGTFKATLSLRAVYNSDPAQKADRDKDKADAAAAKADRDAAREASRTARADALVAKAEAIRNGTARGPGRPPKGTPAPTTDPAVVGSTEETEALDESATESDDDF